MGPKDLLSASPSRPTPPSTEVETGRMKEEDWEAEGLFLCRPSDLKDPVTDRIQISGWDRIGMRRIRESREATGRVGEVCERISPSLSEVPSV